VSAPTKLQIAMSLSDWGSLAGVVGGAVAIVGLIFVVVQLQGAAASARAQATIQFQEAFRSSAPARHALQASFPIHQDVLWDRGTPELENHLASWNDLSDLSKEQRAQATAVINAMNDVAQYVADGLSLRSALQQYHTVFIRTGVLLNRYIDDLNRPLPSGKQARIGRRVPLLYNAALAYHRSNPKHAGRELVIERQSTQGGGAVRLVILDEHGNGVDAHPGFEDDDGGGSGRPARIRLWFTIRVAERVLRT
jgi:hypothetical protein